MPRLFREEVLQAQHAHYLGTVRVGRNPSFTVVATIAVLLAIALVAFATWGEVTRKARLPGLLMPTLGALDLTTPQSGTLLELRVKEGDIVPAGQVLMVIGTDRATAAGDTAALIAHSLQQRRSTLKTERHFAELQTEQRKQALADRVRSTEAELRQAEGELEALQGRLRLATKSVERYQELAMSGFVSDIQVQQKQEDLLDLHIRERNAQRTLTTLARDTRSLRADETANASALQM